MSATKVKKIKKAKITFSDEVKDYSNEPIFVQRAKEAEEFLKKIGLPKEIKR